MSKPGPRPMPTVVRIQSGNAGKRAINHDEPKPTEILDEHLECPEVLEGAGREQWEKMVPILVRMRVLTEADLAMLTQYCILHNVLMDSYRDLKKTGTLTINKKTKAVSQNPLLGIVTRTIAAMKPIAVEFGLTPSSRARMSSPGSGSKNPYDEFDD